MRRWVIQHVLSLQTHFKVIVNRIGGLPLFLFVIAGAAMVYSMLRKRRLASGSDPQISRTGRSSSLATDSRGSRGLDGVRRITVGLDTSIPVVLQRDKASGLMSLDKSTLASFSKLVSRFDVFIIVRVDDDESEEKVHEAFKASGLFQHGLNPLKIIFCETPVGRVSSVRQLEPHLHVDCDLVIVSELQRFIRKLLYVNVEGSGSSSIGSNVMECTSLDKLFE
ncbi:hypothetical protein NDN08_008170 [Rhodosorus marinus]|uniref:Peroxisome biogenesis protein 22 n=1 Tax=Rhodosorus marinus TaxID=101924 RepID=A0AAV8UZN2_9RHOD|nr:hypothetical protein NDN08_008170 [Rhodosorus marinus]